MAKLGDDKKQVTLVLDLDFFKRIEQDAEDEVRNVNTQIIYMLKSYYKTKDLS